jgi:hypothetical protein
MYTRLIYTFVLLVVIIRVFFAGMIIRFTNVLSSIQMSNAKYQYYKYKCKLQIL